MAKIKPSRPVAVEAARRVLAECDVRHPHDIKIEVMCAKYEAYVRYAPLETARATLVVGGERAVVRIDERLEGTLDARTSAAHELAHKVMHADRDHFMQCVDGEEPRPGRAWQSEIEAYDFGREVLIPEPLAASTCAAPRPALEDVERLALRFRTALDLTMIRWVQLADAAGVACAGVLWVGDRVKWAAETRAFPGKIVRGRALHDRSVAHRLACTARHDDAVPREVPGVAWGVPAQGGFVEQAIRIDGERGLSWIVS